MISTALASIRNLMEMSAGAKIVQNKNFTAYQGLPAGWVLFISLAMHILAGILP